MENDNSNLEWDLGWTFIRENVKIKIEKIGGLFLCYVFAFQLKFKETQYIN